MRLIIASLALAVAPLAPAAGQAVGMQVVDTAGGPVGSVVAIKGDTVTVKTDRHEVALPKSSFTPHEGKLLFGMTRAELNAATDQTLAEAAAALQVGAVVRGSAGTPVGTIDAIDEQFVTLKLDDGALIRLPRSGIGPSEQGAIIGFTVEQLRAQVEAATADAGGAQADASGGQ